MSYIKGQTLDDYIQTLPGHRLPIKEVIKIGMQVCDVLHYLHSQRPPIIFRDVKPANLMRTPKGEIYLIDFGIARRYMPERTKDTGPLGSPGYAAPEQYGLSQTTALTDIYGLGATLQTLLTGKEPYEQTTATSLLSAQHSRYARLRRLLDRMLEKESRKRPKHIEEVRAWLENILHGRGWSVWPYVKGLLWGAGPYVLIMGLAAFLASFSGPYPYASFDPSSQYYSPLAILIIPLNYCACIGPLLFLGQLVTGFIMLASPRDRLAGLGLLSGLVLVLLFVWALSVFGAQSAGLFLWPFVIGGD
jgi:serine/threonine protein kinase